MRTALTLVAALVALQACSGAKDDAARTDSPSAATKAPADSGSKPANAPSATAQIKNAAGRDIGSVTLSETADGISISGHLTGLPPGDHGIHLHMTGQCAPPFTTAGGHWNPTTKQHGSQNPQGPHLGDMPNITVGADSSVHAMVSTAGGTLKGANGLLDADGAAVVIHAKADDLKTDPSGNSGDRIACGVISGT